MNYLLSTGDITDKIEIYILDLFNLYLSIYPGDIPGRKDIGFDFIMTDANYSNLKDKIQYRIETLIDTISEKYYNKYNIKISSLEIINETTINIVIELNELKSDIISIDLQKLL